MKKKTKQYTLSRSAEFVEVFRIFFINFQELGRLRRQNLTESFVVLQKYTHRKAHCTFFSPEKLALLSL